MRILVGGGSGFIGSHLKRLLEHHGHDMISVCRKPLSANDISWSSLKQNGLPGKLDAVLNLAGVNIFSPTRWSEDFKRSVISSRVDTTRILCNAVKRSDMRPKTFVAISAIGFYGSHDRGHEVSEMSTPGDDFPAQLCQQWEAAVDMSETDVRKVTVRIGLVLGRDGGLVKQMYWPFFLGLGGPIGSGAQWFPWIHALDVAGIIMHAIENEQVTGILNAVAPETVTNGKFAQIFARSMWRFSPLTVPTFALKCILGEVRAEMMTSSPKIVPVRTLETGYQFVFPDLAAACTDITKWAPYDMLSMKS